MGVNAVPSANHPVELICVRKLPRQVDSLKLDFIRPGKPTGNGHIDDGRLRDECLNVTQFLFIDDARDKIEAWCIDCDAHRPDSSLGNLTPSEFAGMRQGNRTSEVASL